MAWFRRFWGPTLVIVPDRLDQSRLLDVIPLKLVLRIVVEWKDNTSSKQL